LSSLARSAKPEAVKTDLDHLPQAKRDELARVVKILFEEFEDALLLKTGKHRKAGRILKVILFGSYARGDWAEDPKGGYFSDYDILVVVNHQELVDLDYWVKADDHLMREVTISKRISVPVNFIVHSLGDVNNQLKHGRYFFRDVARDGIALYEAPNHPLAQIEPLSREAARAEALNYYNAWYPSVAPFLRGSRYALGDGDLKKAAFDLHQATERLYHCLLLVITLYSPKSHKIGFLRSLCEDHEPPLIQAWPRESKFERRCFELLRRAYVDARYSPHYKITDTELAWLIERVELLNGLVRAACEQRLSA
jgi:predicted nucleotidyltransferase/HEPN domain-containing protein